MMKLFCSHPESVTNTSLIAERCNVIMNLDSSIKLLKFQVESITDNDFYFRSMCEKGLVKRYGSNIVWTWTENHSRTTFGRILLVLFDIFDSILPWAILSIQISVSFWFMTYSKYFLFCSNSNTFFSFNSSLFHCSFNFSFSSFSWDFQGLEIINLWWIHTSRTRRDYDFNRG